MQWTIQLGDLASRLSRGLGVTGKVATSLNDPVLPVALVTDLTQIPYADDPVRCVYAMQLTANAATPAFALLQTLAPRTRVRRVQINADKAAPLFSLAIGRQVSAPGLASGVPFVVNLPTQKGANQQFSQAKATVGANAATITGTIRTFYDHLGNDFDLTLDLDGIVLFPGDGIVFLIDAPLAVNQYRATFWFDEHTR